MTIQEAVYIYFSGIRPGVSGKDYFRAREIVRSNYEKAKEYMRYDRAESTKEDNRLSS